MTGGGPRVGLVLGGGGVAGYAFHVAVLTALQDQTGFDPRTAEIVVGTSAGAIAAALLRGDVAPHDVRERLLAGLDEEVGGPLRQLGGPTPKAVPRLWAGPGAPRMAVRELRRGRRLKVSKLVAALLPQGRATLAPLIGPLTELHPTGWPARPLWIPVTDQASGHRLVFGRDDDPADRPPVADAVVASAALPLFFAPVEIGGRLYIDGGVGSPFNADLLVPHPVGTDRLDLVIILAPLSIDRPERTTPLSSAARSLPRRRLVAETGQLAAAGVDTLVLQPDRPMVAAMGLNPMDHDRVPAIVEASADLVGRLLEAAGGEVTALLRRAAATLVSPPDADYPPL